MQPQFGLMPAARMTPAHFGSSPLISAATSSAVAVDGSKPSARSHASTSGNATARAISSIEAERDAEQLTREVRARSDAGRSATSAAEHGSGARLRAALHRSKIAVCHLSV